MGHPSGRGGAATDRTAPYLHYGVLLISVPNAVVIGLMVVVFALAVALRMPRADGGGRRRG